MIEVQNLKKYYRKDPVLGRTLHSVTLIIVVTVLMGGCIGQTPESTPSETETQPPTTQPPTPKPPSISNGGLIAFISERDGNPEIYVMNADGSDQKRLTYNNCDDWAPDWSPDSEKIAFTSGLNGNLDIYIMNADGSGIQQITDNTSDDGWSSWSPDKTATIFIF